MRIVLCPDVITVEAVEGNSSYKIDGLKPAICNCKVFILLPVNTQSAERC